MTSSTLPLFDAVHAVPCLACGAGPRARCKTPSETIARVPHRDRIRAASLPRDAHASPRPASRVLVDATRAGALTVQEQQLQGDSLDAWRVALACAILARVQIAAAAPVVDEVLARWPTPARLVLAHFDLVTLLLAPVGHARARAHALHRLSVAELHGDAIEPLCAEYTRDSIALFVCNDLSRVPRDSVLSAARDRLLARSQPALAGARAAVSVMGARAKG